MAPLKLLFVCGYGRDRSRTAADLYRAVPGVEVSFGGIVLKARWPVNGLQVLWADIIVTMQKDQLYTVQRRFTPYLAGKRVVTLGIANRYKYGSPELQAAILATMRQTLPDIPHPD